MALLVLACVGLAAVAGAVARAMLPDRHFDADSKDVIKLIMGFIATITALVLGLLIASANASYTSKQSELQKFAVEVVELDRILQRYGPEADEARTRLAHAVLVAHSQIWGEADRVSLNLEGGQIQSASDAFFAALQALSPKNDLQQFARNQALQVAVQVAQSRVELTQSAGSSVPWPLVGVLIGWICVLFFGFGLLAPRHITAAVALAIGAASASVAILMIVELNDPFSGIMRLPDTPLRNAMRLLHKPGTV